MADTPQATLSHRLVRSSVLAALLASYLAFAAWVIDWEWSPWSMAGFATVVAGLFTVEFLSRAVEREPLLRRLTPFILVLATLGTYSASTAVFGFAFDKTVAFFILLAVPFAYDMTSKRRHGHASPAAREEALRFSPPEGHALVIVVRDSRIAADVPLHMTMGDRAFPLLFGPGFSSLAVPAGTAVLRAGLRWDAVANDGPNAVALNLGSGDVRVFQAKLSMDMARVYLRLEPIDLAEAREQIGDLPMAA